MKVLMFGWEFPPHISGGLGTACFGLTKGLAVHDVEILFVVPKAFGDESQEAVKIIGAGDVRVQTKRLNYNEIWKDITYIEVGSNLVPYLSAEEYENFVKEPRLASKEYSETDDQGFFNFTGKYGPSLMQDVSNYAAVASVIAANNEFDVIHAHDWLTYAAGVAAKRVSGKPLVVHVHATEFDRTGENVNTIVFDIEKMGMQNADYVITVSNLTRNIVIEKYGIPAEKVITVYNAVEPQELKELVEFKKGVKEKIVTFLGRITFQKGPEYFVEAASQVLKRYKDVRFVMAGSGDMMNKVIRRAAELGIADKFHFAGFLRGDDVEKMFLMSDVYVMPSVSEPFGISPLEAMQSNVPVIISKQSGVAEVLNHAIKVDFWDTEAIADAIYALLNYDALSKIFKEFGKTEVDNLKWENAAEQIKKIYTLAMK